MWRWLLGIALVAAAAVGIIIGALNPDPVTLDLAVFRWTASLGTVFVAGAAAGLIVGMVVVAPVLALRRRPRGAAAGRTPGRPDA